MRLSRRDGALGDDAAQGGRGGARRRAAATWRAVSSAVNCVVNREGALFGTNTDGEGFVASLARGAGFEPGRAPLPRGGRRRRGAGRRAGARAAAGPPRWRWSTGRPNGPYQAAELAGAGGLGGAADRRVHRRGSGGGGPGRQRHAGGHGRRGRPDEGPGGLARPSGPAPTRPGGRRPGLRPPGDPVARRGDRRRAPRRSTGSGCWCTRRRRSSCCGPASEPPVEAMWRAAEAASQKER